MEELKAAKEKLLEVKSRYDEFCEKHRLRVGTLPKQRGDEIEITGDNIEELLELKDELKDAEKDYYEAFKKSEGG